MRPTEWLAVLLTATPIAPALAQGDLIPVPDRRGHVYSPSRRILFISTSGGLIERYDVVQGILLPPFVVGNSLNGLDLTPEEDRLYVTENQIGTTEGFVYRVDPDSGDVKTLSYDLAFFESGSWDVGIANNGLGFVSTRFAGSGWVPFRELDLATDTLTPRTDTKGSSGSQVRQDTHINRGAGRNLLFMTESNVSNGPVFTYSAATDSFPNSVSTGVFHGSTISSVNRDGTLIAMEAGTSVRILSSTLAQIQTLNGLSGGVIFDPVEDLLYAVNTSLNAVRALETETFTLVSSFPIGESVSNSTPLGSGEMSISPDGDFLFLSTSSGIRAILVGTPAPAVIAVTPDRLAFGDPPVPVLLSGGFFSFGSDTRVFFGQNEASEVTVLGDELIAATPPLGEPGLVDVRVTNTAGEDVLPAGFAYTPALSVSGVLQPGGLLSTELLMTPGEAIYVALSGPPVVSVLCPPLGGTLCLFDPVIVTFAPAWPFDTLTLTIDIPDQPLFSGLEVVVQGLALDGSEGAFTNCGSVQIQ